MKNEDKPCNCVNCNLARVVNDLLNMDQRKPSKPKLSENQIREAMGMRNALAGQKAGVSEEATVSFGSLGSEPTKQDTIENTPGLKGQIGGDYYKTLVIQPVEYCYRNNIPAIEAGVIKYVTRHRAKGGAKDIKKAIHLLTVLLELEYKC